MRSEDALFLVECLRAAKNKMRELSDAERVGNLWGIYQACSEMEATLKNMRYRAIKVGFEKLPKS